MGEEEEAMTNKTTEMIASIATPIGASEATEQLQWALAHKRDEKKVLEDSLQELELVPEFACKAFYVIPFKNKSTGEVVNVEGPSI